MCKGKRRLQSARNDKPKPQYPNIIIIADISHLQQRRQTEIKVIKVIFRTRHELTEPIIS